MAGGCLWLASFIPSVLLPANKAYQWLRYGHYDTDPTLTDLVAKPAFSWVGVQHMTDWLWSHSLAITSPMIGLVAYGFLYLMSRDVADRTTPTP